MQWHVYTCLYDVIARQAEGGMDGKNADKSSNLQAEEATKNILKIILILNKIIHVNFFL